jgi:photosystem II stability/assembly factor-like uncharacterized protein
MAMESAKSSRCFQRLTGLVALSTLVILAGCMTPLKPAQNEVSPSDRGIQIDAVSAANQRWALTAAEPYRGKQDDVFFISPNVGWYVNGTGKIFGTRDSGASWTLLKNQPGTFFRTIAFIDEKHGLVGNVGTDYFPGVTDETPLYETRDGGVTWTAVALPAPGSSGTAATPLKGLCAIDIVRVPFINHGVLAERVVIHAAGRVGGPGHILRSLDGGASWKHVSVPAIVGPILDIKFFNDRDGLVFAGTRGELTESNALILATDNGGETWREVYRSQRPYEITWKASFPTRNTGFVSVQSYDPDPKRAERVVAKTTDGGRTWREIPLVSEHAVREFGIGFVTPELGWVGVNDGAFQTSDGGASWKRVAPTDIGRAVNKIRVLPDRNGFVAYAVGTHVARFAFDGAR